MSENKNAVKTIDIPLPPARYIPPILPKEAQVPVFERKKIFNATLAALRAYPSPHTFFALSNRDIVRYINMYFARLKGKARIDYRLSFETLKALLALYEKQGMEAEYFQKYRNCAQLIEIIDAMRLSNKIQLVDNLYNSKSHVNAEKFKFMLERKFREDWGQEVETTEINITGIQLTYNKAEIPVSVISSESDMESHMNKIYGHANGNGHHEGLAASNGS